MIQLLYKLHIIDYFFILYKIYQICYEYLNDSLYLNGKNDLYFSFGFFVNLSDDKYHYIN